MTDKVINQAFDTWADFFRPFASDRKMDILLNYVIGEERKHQTVYPENKHVFRCFKECPYPEIKVVLVGLDPYIHGEACGLSFALNPDFEGKVPASLKNIITELKDNYPDTVVDYSLASWPKQGILMYNTALTVREKATKSHWKEWQPFTHYLFQTLNERNTGLIYVLLGKDAQAYEKYVNIDANYVLKFPHPASEAYTGGNSGFFNSGIFLEINKLVKKIYGEEIVF